MGAGRRVLPTAHGDLTLPVFLPDATYGVVRAVDAADLAGAGVRAVMVNTLHLSHRPGLSVIETLGGVHRFMGWTGPVISDSGGFQVLSLSGRGGGTVSDAGLKVRAEGRAKADLLSPESAVERQFRLGSDVVICLDECTHPKAPRELQRDSVRRTLLWARRGKEEHARQVEASAGKGRPLLVAVVQGGNDPDLRRRCAEGLMELGFDGYGFGGWPLERSGKLVEAVAETATLLPPAAPKWALGIGGPENVVAAHAAGWQVFDCTLPTRDARHGRLYAFRDGVGLDGDFCERLDLTAERFARDGGPVETGCDCATCRTLSRAYLRHLFAVGDIAAARHATIHNLRFWTRLFGRLA